MPVNLYYTQKVRGFQQTNVKYSNKGIEIRLKRTKHQCSNCGSAAVSAEPILFMDREYFKLKIYQLLEISSSKGI